MTNNLMEYKGFFGSVEFSAEDSCLVGKVEFIDDLILFHGSTVEDIKKEFHDAIDSYIQFCTSRGQQPGTTYKGAFNVRVGPALHRKAAIAAKKSGKTLNEFVKYWVEYGVQDQHPVSVQAVLDSLREHSQELRLEFSSHGDYSELEFIDPQTSTKSVVTRTHVRH